MLTLDHAGLIAGDQAEMKAIRKWLLEAGDVVKMAVMHEHDGSCCARESWEQTLGRITRAVMPGRGVLNVNMNLPPEGETAEDPWRDVGGEG